MNGMPEIVSAAEQPIMATYRDRSANRARAACRSPDFVVETFREQRADRAVDQAGGQRFFFGRTAFALEEATGDFTGGEGLFLIVNREREEIDIRLRGFLGNHGAEHSGVAVRGEHGAIGLTGDAAGFEGEHAATPFDGAGRVLGPNKKVRTLFC
jgi:hypothetical protein